MNKKIKELIRVVKLLIGDKEYGCSKHSFITDENCKECQKYEAVRKALKELGE